MKAELGKLARHRLSRARDAFAEGEHLFAIGSFNGSVNRFYYAAFYAARALLAVRELDSSRHSGVIALFQKHFVKSGLVAIERQRLCRELLKSVRKAIMAIFQKLQCKTLKRFGTTSICSSRRARKFLIIQS
ncbi:MAG: HEPN domain-containing protein [Candidatus Binatia bacterium]